MSEKYDEQGIEIKPENCIYSDVCTSTCDKCDLRFIVTPEARKARIAELTAFVKRVANSQIPSVRHGTSNEIELIHEARALLRGGEGK